MSTIRQNIQAYRNEKSMSVEELAIRIRCGTKTLEDYEKGINIPNNQTLLMISTVLDVPASELLEHHIR